jgi:hypothetical protein
LELECTVVGTEDVDADGLPDDWELFNLHSLTHNSSSDPDGDGVSNSGEFRAGTDPLSAASHLRILSITQSATGGAALRFPHAASRRYTVESSENFDTWITKTNAPVFDLATGMVNWTDDAKDVSQRFYRVNSDLFSR